MEDAKPQTLDPLAPIQSTGDFYSIDYDSLDVSIGYRGKRLGYMSSDGGGIKARQSSYVNATPHLDATEVLSDAIYLIEAN
ncbi:hypothetical protein CASFOL_012277 [Castilleja foliolosa]|uniref:Late embryogenesis abundant protein LEA-2 subgroup domain-containing protein n=1 Tax=Castilleja foliolosa TaxID=1961234 RepID=A0ABD3DQ41_9LAMI